MEHFALRNITMMLYVKFAMWKGQFSIFIFCFLKKRFIITKKCAISQSIIGTTREAPLQCLKISCFTFRKCLKLASSWDFRSHQHRVEASINIARSRCPDLWVSPLGSHWATLHAWSLCSMQPGWPHATQEVSASTVQALDFELLTLTHSAGHIPRSCHAFWLFTSLLFLAFLFALTLGLVLGVSSELRPWLSLSLSITGWMNGFYFLFSFSHWFHPAEFLKQSSRLYMPAMWTAYLVFLTANRKYLPFPESLSVPWFV